MFCLQFIFVRLIEYELTWMYEGCIKRQHAAWAVKGDLYPVTIPENKVGKQQYENESR